MSPAKTNAQRQANLKARRLVAGLVLFKAWVHTDDAHALREAADKLARKRDGNAKRAAP